VILGADRLVANYSNFVAKRYGWSPDAYDLTEVHEAVTEARALATNESEEPAALFYALARRPRAFPEGWRVMARAAAMGHAHALGYAFDAKPDSLDAWVTRVVNGEASFGDVRGWFAGRMTRR
jgi:hypothetical protein